MGAKVYDTIIPRNVRISEAPSYGKPVLVYDLKCVGSEAYLRLATEIIQRERELKDALSRRMASRDGVIGRAPPCFARKTDGSPRAHPAMINEYMFWSRCK